MKHVFLSAFATLAVNVSGFAGPELAAPSELPVPPPQAVEPALRGIAQELVTRSGAPGALLGVAQGSRRWVVSAGGGDLLGQTPLRQDGIFPVGSL